MRVNLLKVIFKLRGADGMKRACHRRLASLTRGLQAYHNPTLPPLILMGGEEGLHLLPSVLELTPADLKSFFIASVSLIEKEFAC